MRFNKRFINLLLVLLLLSVQFIPSTTMAFDGVSDNNSGNITPFVGDLNIDITLEPRDKAIESGNDLLYSLIFKTTGAQKHYENAKVIIDLPEDPFVKFQQSLKELTIAGVTPVHKKELNQLVYEFDDLKTGQTYETTLKLSSLNGLTPTGSSVDVKAHFLTDKLNYTDEASILVEASNPIVLTKTYDGVLKEEGVIKQYPRLRDEEASDEMLWTINLDIQKKSTGQLFLDGDYMIVEDILPVNFQGEPILEFLEMIQGEEPFEVTEEKITWKIPVPSLDEQNGASEKLFETQLQMKLAFTENAAIGDGLLNKASVEAKFIGDQMNTVLAQDKTIIVNSEGKTYDKDGIWPVIGHFGPKDGFGNMGDVGYGMDPNPAVYDGSTLAFSHYITSFDLGQYDDFKKYDLYYEIDDALTLESLKAPGEFWYYPNFEYPQNVPLEKQPVYEIKGIVNGEERVLVEDPLQNKVYSREDLGLDEDDHLSLIHYDFSYAPAGMAVFAYMDVVEPSIPIYTFSIEENYEGEVANGIVVEFTDYYSRDTTLNLKDPSVFGNLGGIRHAQVIPSPGEKAPIAEIGIQLDKEFRGEVTPGENSVTVSFTNHEDSTSRLKKDIEAYTLLPTDVTVEEDVEATYKYEGQDIPGTIEILDNNYENSNRQLIKITWKDRDILIGKKVTAHFDLQIDKATPKNLRFDVFGFTANDSLKVPKTSTPSITDTILEKDIEDLNGNGDIDEDRIKSANLYILRGDHDLKTEKYVKGSLDKDWTSYATTIPGGDIDYKIKLTNTSGLISSMTLIDVLPSVGDLGITDNVARGSKFTPKMTGPIALPKDWKNKVDIFYSKAKNPKRDDLIKNTIYPVGATKLTNPKGAEDPHWMTEEEVVSWEEIHSFKIELKDSVSWIKGDNIEIEFSMKAPNYDEIDEQLLNEDADLQDRLACNSFALATDHAQPVEPYQVCALMKVESIDIAVEKVWELVKKDKVEVTIQLLQNNLVIDSLKLSDENNWKDIFTNLPKYNEKGKPYSYIVKEVELEDFNTRIEGDAATGFVITNEEITEEPPTPPSPEDPEEPEKPGNELPKTATNMYNFLLIGMIILVLGFGVILFNRLRN